jgi:hypothetical protein
MFVIEIRKETDGFLVSMFIIETGEIREVKRATLESAMRTLGRTLDHDHK